jgi:hypothetical protein
MNSAFDFRHIPGLMPIPTNISTEMKGFPLFRIKTDGDFFVCKSKWLA